MTVLVHSRFLAGMAVHVGDDPHLRPGVHLRVLPSLDLALPVAPMAVYRLRGGHGGVGSFRTEMVWTDSHGNVLVPPFEVRPDNPVRGRFRGPPGTRCCWVEVEAEPQSASRPGGGGGPGGGPGGWPFFELDPRVLRGLRDLQGLTYRVPAVVRFLELERYRIGGASPSEPPSASPPEPRSSLQVVALGGRAMQGPEPLGSRSSAPWALAAGDIREVLVIGAGRVLGARWLDVGLTAASGGQAAPRKPLQLGAPWRLLELPSGTEPRYRALEGWEARLRDRILRGAPRRLGYHDRPDEVSPSGLPGIAPTDEEIRMHALQGTLETYLKTVLSRPIPAGQSLRDLAEAETLAMAGPDGPVAEASVPALGALLSGTVDPGVARWLGLMDRDEAPMPLSEPGAPVVYLVRGFWVPRLKGPVHENFMSALLLRMGMRPVSDGAATWPALGFQPPRLVEGVAPFEGWTVAVAAASAPPDPPEAPLVGPELAPRHPPTPDGLGRWLPTPAGTPSREARRQVTLALGGLTPMSTLAVARDTREGGSVSTEGLNPRIPTLQTRALSYSPEQAADTSLEADDASPTTEPRVELSHRIEDRGAAGEGTSYRVAQTDAFGRWSPWGRYDAADKAPPPPPPPVLQLTYQLPEEWDVPGADPRWGRLRIEVAVPSPEDLPPGGWPVGSLRVELRSPGAGGGGGGGGVPLAVEGYGPWVVEDHLSAADGPPSVVVTLEPTDLARLRPGLGDGETALLEVVGWWIDTQPAPVESREGDPRALEVRDPRPPAVVPMDPALRYTARPDVDGYARVTLALPRTSGVERWAVYVSDETRLLAALRGRSQGEPLVEVAVEGHPPDVADEAEVEAIEALLAQAEAAPDIAHRAQAFAQGDRPSLLRKPWFQRLEVPAAASGDTPFSHELSGALRVAAFFRVVPMNALGVEGDFRTSPLLPVGVPSGGAPPTPVLAVLPSSPADAGDPPVAPLEIRVPQGAVPAAGYRVRRSGAGHRDPRRMLVVHQGSFPDPPAPGEGGEATPPRPGQRLVVSDAGGLPHDPARTLRPFTRYAWRVEVQAPAPPGSTTPGEWSAPSAPASQVFMPPPPVAPEDARILADASGDLILSWTYSGPLRGGGMGVYRFLLEQSRADGSVASHELLLPARPAPPAAPGETPRFEWIVSAAGDPPPSDEEVWRIRTVDPAGRAGPPSAPVRIP